MNIERPAFMTVPQFLREYPVGRTRFYEDVKVGRIRTIKSGTRTLVPSSELDRLERESGAAYGTNDDHAA